jgi:HD superfamily phosphohydrolase
VIHASSGSGRSAKIIRDPLYNYISIDRRRDGWLLDLLDCAEVQRLRRIHQLGLSYLTYPGADHNRLAHSLGVLHLMQGVMQHLEAQAGEMASESEIESARVPLLAAALIHDVGHGPFSHVFEPCLGVQHEYWSQRVILDEDTEVNAVLRRLDSALPQRVAGLIDPDNFDQPAWMKYLLSSQLDMDRLDYLRRDSLCTGAGCGHYDWFRILTTLELHGSSPARRDIVWPEKAMLAIEEYIFARYYMYQNVYLHKTTRGFEKIVETLWARARALHRDGHDAALLPAIARFWSAQQPSVADYLAIEEFSFLQQIQNWTTHPDRQLSELARRFLQRQRLVPVDPPQRDDFAPDDGAWEAALHELLRQHGYDPATACLRDQVKAKFNQPYFPEKESDEQSVQNAIRLRVSGEPEPVEISRLLPRLQSLTHLPTDRVRYYVPPPMRDLARELASRVVVGQGNVDVNGRASGA